MKLSFLPVVVAVLVAILCASVTGCGPSPKAVTPEEQQKLDDDMKKAVEHNKTAK